MPSVLIVDDHILFGEVLLKALEQEGEFQLLPLALTGVQAIQRARDARPQVILMDINIPELSGVDAAQEILRFHPSCQILALSSENSLERVVQCMKNGFAGYLCKTDSVEQVIQAVRQSLLGQQFFLSPSFGSQAMAEIIELLRKPARPEESSALSKREESVVKLVAEGLSSKEVADRLEISPRTVEAHRNAIYKKLGIKNLAELVRYALEHNLLDSNRA